MTDVKDDTKDDLLLKFQGSWAVASTAGVMTHLKNKYGNKAMEMINAKNYTVEDMDSPHHFEVMNIQGDDPKLIGTSYYFLAPNTSSGDAISQTIYALLDGKSETGPFPGPLGTMVHVTAQYDIKTNAIFITYTGKQTSTAKRYFDSNGILTEEFTVKGSFEKKTKQYFKVSNKRLVFSPSYGIANGTSRVIKNEVTIVDFVQAFWLPDTLQIVGLRIYFRGAHGEPITVGQTDGTETKLVGLPSKNVSFNIWTTNNNPLSGSVCAIQFGDGTKPITEDNPIIGVLPDNPVPFLYNIPAYPLYCIGFVCVFDAKGHLNSFASLNAYEEPSI